MVLGAVLSGALLGALQARAEAPSASSARLRLSWDAPEACAVAADVVERTETILGAGDAEQPLAAAGRVQRTATGAFALELTIAQGDEVRSRRRALLSRMRSKGGPPPGARSRVWKRVVATTAGTTGLAAAGTTGAAAATSSGGTVLTLVGKWLAVGFCVGATTSGSLALVSKSWEASTAPTARVASIPSGEQPEPRILAASAELPLAEPSATIASRPHTRPRAPVGETATQRPPSLAGEAQLLEAAQRALRRGKPEQALDQLDQHQQRYAGGVLQEEAAATRVLVFCAQGRVAEARVLGRAFVARYPRSPLVPRVAGACAQSRDFP